MRPPIARSTLIKTGVLFAIWTAYGLLSACQEHYWYSSTKTPMSWVKSLHLELTYSYVWALCTPVILWTAKRFRFERQHWTRNLLIHLLAMIVIVAVNKTVYDAVSMSPTSPYRDFTLPKYLRSIEQNFDIGILLYAVIILVDHSLVYYQRYQQGLANAANLQMQLVQAQLRALKMQLHPHFLFNTLNTITALVKEDPELAESTI